MACPLLARASPPACTAVEGEPRPPTRAVASTFCRDAHDLCPAWRFVKAAGRRVNPADFDAWVLADCAPGRTGPPPSPP